MSMNFSVKLNDLSKLIKTNYEALFLEVPKGKPKSVNSQSQASGDFEKIQTNGRRGRRSEGYVNLLFVVKLILSFVQNILV